MTVRWDDKLLTGILEVDNQHKEIFNRADVLINACNNRKGREEVIKTFAFLEDYVITHLKAEEAVMYKYSYPQHISHIAQHSQYKSVVSELKKELEKDGATGLFVINVNHKIVGWLLSHILKEDKALSEFIRKQS